MLKFILAIILSVLLFYPSAYFAHLLFESDERTQGEIFIPIFIGNYASSLLTLWHMVVSEKWRTFWTKRDKNGLWALVILGAFVPGFVISTVFGFIALRALSSSVYGAVALALNGIPASIAASLIASGSLKAPLSRGERYRDIFVLVVIGAFLVFLFSTEPFLQFPTLLAFEIVGAIAYAILRSFELKRMWLVVSLSGIGVILLVLAYNFIARATVHLYLGSLTS